MTRTRRHLGAGHHGPRGAILLAVLVTLALVGLASTIVYQRTSAQQQRANEAELLFVGQQYRSAIESYLRQAPNGVRRYPTKLEDLLADDRYPQPKRHLRKLFRDPMTPNGEWQLIKVGNAIIGVRSQSTGTPFRKVGFPPALADFASAQTYADWQFKVSPPALPGAQPGTAPGTPPVPKPTPRAPQTPAFR